MTGSGWPRLCSEPGLSCCSLLRAVERPRQHRPGRTKPLKLDFERLDPVPRRLRALAQAGVLPGQRLDRSLLAPRPSQSPAEIGVCNGQRLRQRLPDRSKPGKLGLECLPDRAKLGRLNRQRRFPGLQLPHGPAQTAVVLAQRLDRRLLAPRSPQGRAQLSSLVGRQLRQRRPGPPEAWRAGPSTSPYRLWTPPGHGAARKPRRTATGRGPRRRPVSSPPGGAEGDSLDSFFAVSLMRSVLSFSWSRRVFSRTFSLSRRTTSLSSRRSSVRSDLTVSFWSGEGLQDGAPPGRSGPRPGSRPHGPSMPPGPCAAGRSPCAAPRRIEGRRDAGFRKERLQARHFRLQGRHVPCRAAGFLRLFDGLTQPAPAGLEPRLPRTAIAAGGHFRPAQLFRARFGRVRPRPFPLTL